MFREILRKLAEINYIVTLEHNCCIVKNKIENQEFKVIEYLDKDRDKKLRDCYYELILQ